MERRLRIGMVGGGDGAFIGSVHRMAARLDGLIELVAGAFSSDPERSRAFGRGLFLEEGRCYGSYLEMVHAERTLPASVRIDAVVIATPNDLHAPVAAVALEHGFDVVCDKPLALDLAQALELEERVRESGRTLCVTYNYTGYPLIKEARARIRRGELGQLRRILVEYPQGWLATPLERGGHKQASWRTDPARAGDAGCLGDIGTHAANLIEYTSGLEIEAVHAEVTTHVPGRRVDDDLAVLLRLAGGARATLSASQVAVGEENALALRIYGEHGSLTWRQEEPSTLIVGRIDQPQQIVRAGTSNGALSEAARWSCRLPGGHPEGFIEAFANLYRDVALTLDRRRRGLELEGHLGDFPTVRDGVRGMRFVDAVLRSAANDTWVAL